MAAVIGVLAPRAVYGHDDAIRRPLIWAVVHAVFVLAASAAQITTWRVTETQHERSEDALRSSERWFRALIEHSRDGVSVIGGDWRIRYDSPSVEREFGMVDRIGSSGVNGVHPDDVERLRPIIADLTPGSSPVVEYRIVGAHGTRWVESQITDLRAVPDVEGIVVNFRDVSERRELEQQLAHQAFHDALTGLPNRTLFADRIDRAISAQRRGGRPRAAVLFIDLDDFKLVNDGMGHVTGDEVLIEAGRRIARCLRPGDTCARLGGDEFGVLLEEVGDGAYDAGVRLLEALEGEVTTTAGSIRLEASIGLAYAGPGDLRERHARGGARAVGAQGRHAPRPRRRRVRAALPAGGVARPRPCHRRRGTRPLGAPRARSTGPPRLHRARRGERRHCRDRARHPAPGVRRRREVARLARHQREPVGPPAPGREPRD